MGTPEPRLEHRYRVYPMHRGFEYLVVVMDWYLPAGRVALADRKG